VTAQCAALDANGKRLCIDLLDKLDFVAKNGRFPATTTQFELTAAMKGYIPNILKSTLEYPTPHLEIWEKAMRGLT
jgi:hypothetical protein